MNKRNIVIGTFFLGIIIASIVFYFIYNKPHKDYASAEATYAFTADELFNIYNENPAKASEITGKVISVIGEIEEIAVGQDGTLNIILSAENAFVGGINAQLSTNSHESTSTLNEGDEINIKCRCLGFDDTIIAEVKLDNCFID